MRLTSLSLLTAIKEVSGSKGPKSILGRMKQINVNKAARSRLSTKALFVLTVVIILSHLKPSVPPAFI